MSRLHGYISIYLFDIVRLFEIISDNTINIVCRVKWIFCWFNCHLKYRYNGYQNEWYD